MSHKSCNILECACLLCTYLVAKAVQATVVGSIVVVGELTCCALLHSEYDLKAAQMNVKYDII